MRYFFHIGYNGANYSGWQRHPYAHNVQEVIENSLHRIFKIFIPIVGCGRTDALVHAGQFFFHMDVEKAWEFDLLFRLNKLLPADIAVFDIIPMEGLPHARFDATQRSYDYFIHTYKDPFLSSVSSLYLQKNLNLPRMKQAVSLLLQYSDYRAFCKSPAQYDHTICLVTSANLFTDKSGDRLRFSISANRFLGSMIRIIVGKLIRVGRGVLSLEEFESYLITKKTPPAITPAYPQGLYLSKIVYPYLDLPPRPSLSAILQDQHDAAWQEV